ncbi:hypothetical protein ACOMHN_013391 [Nucella lapillus]
MQGKLLCDQVNPQIKMATSGPSKSYGLFIPKKTNKGPVLKPAAANVFGDDSDELTNGAVLEIVKCGQSSSLSLDSLASIIARFCKSSAKEGSIRSVILRQENRRKKLRGPALRGFLAKPFPLPRPKATLPTATEPIPAEPIPTEPIPTEPTQTEPIPTEPIQTEPIPTLSTASKTPSPQPSCSTSTSFPTRPRQLPLTTPVKRSNLAYHDGLMRMRKLKQQITILEQTRKSKIKVLQSFAVIQNPKKGHFCPRNVQKREQRARDNISRLKQEKRALMAKLSQATLTAQTAQTALDAIGDGLAESSAESSSKIQILKSKLQRQQRMASHFRTQAKLAKQREKSSEKKYEQLEKLFKKLEKENELLKSENQQLHEDFDCEKCK